MKTTTPQNEDDLTHKSKTTEAKIRRRSDHYYGNDCGYNCGDDCGDDCGDGCGDDCDDYCGDKCSSLGPSYPPSTSVGDIFCCGIFLLMCRIVCVGWYGTVADMYIWVGMV